MSSNLLTRREMLGLIAAAGASRAFGAVVNSDKNLVPAKEAVDHLLLGVADLDRGIEWFEKATGVRAMIGGSHPGGGTRNALVSLGAKQYLEIIAPDPAQTTFNFPIDIRKLAEPRLITWAASTADINATANKAREGSYQLAGPVDGSRARPDGVLLKWRSMRIQNQFGLRLVEPIPFFIQWAADSVHPSQDSPTGCELQAFEIEYPDPDRLTAALSKLGIEGKVMRAADARLVATLQTPKGKIALR